MRHPKRGCAAAAGAMPLRGTLAAPHATMLSHLVQATFWETAYGNQAGSSGEQKARLAPYPNVLIDVRDHGTTNPSSVVADKGGKPRL